MLCPQGTAINFFVRDLPRLSVDIDLAYLPVEDREASALQGPREERVGGEGGGTLCANMRILA